MTDVLLQGYIGLADLRRLFDEAGMCSGSDVRALDAATNAALDGELRDPATGVCDAVSIAIPFEGVSAGQVGGMFPPPPINTLKLSSAVQSESRWTTAHNLLVVFVRTTDADEHSTGGDERGTKSVAHEGPRSRPLPTILKAKAL